MVISLGSDNTLCSTLTKIIVPDIKPLLLPYVCQPVDVYLYHNALFLECKHNAHS